MEGLIALLAPPLFHAWEFWKSGRSFELLDNRRRRWRFEISSTEMHSCGSFMGARVRNKETNHVGCDYYNWKRNHVTPDFETKFIFKSSNIN
ncbi:hypothetical protein EPI10_014681 [Gossypium australe]|uniref:Uncharacterized protein n=1 Tax=Gossypium australe TaxID=47621 RepID=A0A5B6VIE7_9ROSI|nr:hypothetical protein EPI10_014681 [Gossypium australe]